MSLYPAHIDPSAPPSDDDDRLTLQSLIDGQRHITEAIFALRSDLMAKIDALAAELPAIRSAAEEARFFALEAHRLVSERGSTLPPDRPTMTELPDDDDSD